MLNKLQNSPIARGFTLTILGSGLSKLIIIILTFYCTNRLTKSEFGEYSLLRNTLNMVLCVCALNFSSLCTKFTVEIKTSLDSYYRLLILTAFSLSVCTLLGFFLILLPSNFLESVIGTSNLNSYVKIIGLLLPALISYRGYSQGINGVQDSRYVANNILFVFSCFHDCRDSSQRPQWSYCQHVAVLFILYTDFFIYNMED